MTTSRFMLHLSMGSFFLPCVCMFFVKGLCGIQLKNDMLNSSPCSSLINSVSTEAEQ